MTNARTLSVGLVALALLVFVPGTGAYHIIQHVSPDGNDVELEWDTSFGPVPFFVNNTTPLDFSLEEAVQAFEQSYQAWEDVETATITFELAGLTSAKPFEFFDGKSTLGFTSDPDLASPGVLGATLQVIDIRSGEIVEQTGQLDAAVHRVLHDLRADTPLPNQQSLVHEFLDRPPRGRPRQRQPLRKGQLVLETVARGEFAISDGRLDRLSELIVERDRA